MLNKKEKQALKLLYEHQHNYLTSQEIASQMNLSNRTARKYLDMLESALKKNSIGKIDAKRGCGYQLVICDQKKFEQFYLKEVSNLQFSKDSSAVQESKDRQYYILKRMFFEQSEIFIDHIAEELFVSRSTISNELVEIKKLIRPYNIEVKSKSNKGIFIVGNEQNIRHFMMNYFFVNRLHENLYTFSMYANLLEGINIEEVVIIVLDECREAHLKLSDFMIYNLALHIGLAIKRLQFGFEMQPGIPMLSDTASLEYQMSLKIIQRVKDSLGVHFPAEEADFIAMHLRNKSASETVFQKSFYNEDEIKKQLLDVLKKIDEETGYSLATDGILIDGLMMHFTLLLLRLQNKTTIENPLLEEIQSNYSELLALTMNYFSKMEAFAVYEITLGEWAYITIHLAAATERYINKQKIHVIVICATNSSTFQMLSNRLEREFGNKIFIEKVISYYEVADQDLNNIDMIISTVKLPNMVFTIPIVNVSVFLGEADIQKINNALFRFKGIKQIKSSTQEAKVILEEKIAFVKQCFQPELFIVPDKTMNKEEILNVLIGFIEKAEGKPLKKPFLKQLKLRESYSSVAFSNYLAVPHPIEPLTDTAHVAIAVAPKGIVWDAQHQNIQLVFLLSPDRLNRFGLDKSSPMLVPIIDDKDFQNNLIQSTSFDSFVAAFIQQLEKENF